MKKEKQYKKFIEKKIQSRNTDIENINDEIQNLNAELDELPPDVPKNAELKTKIKEKGILLKNYEQELTVLKKVKPDKVQFQLPSNNLPLMGEKNLRSIKVTFPFLALRSMHISNEIFAPDLVDSGVPTKAQRDISHLILSSLGIDDSQILSGKDITQLKNDLSYLVDTDSGKTGQECLIELGIYDVASQNVDRNQLKKALRFIRENRGNERNFKKLKGQM